MNKKFWNDMREEGFLLVDAPARKIAVFSNTCAEVVLATTQDSKTCICTLDADEVDGLVELLIKAKLEAAPRDAELQAMYAIHCAKMGERA